MTAPRIVTKCATCPLNSGCGGNPNAGGRCLRGDDLAEIATLISQAADLHGIIAVYALRIKELEAALRNIIELYVGEGGYRVKDIARAALSPEQDKCE